MRYRRKIGVLGLILCLCFGVLAGCGGEDGGTTKVVFTTGPGKNEVFRVGDEICTKEQMMIYLTTIQNQYENVYGEEIWQTSLNGVTLEENVKETVLEKMAQIKTMYLLAQKKGLSLDEGEKDLVSKAAKEYVDSLSETEEELLDVSLETVETIYTEYALANKVYLHIIENVNPEISDDEARTITVQHILIRTYTKDNSGNKVVYTEEKKSEAYNKINEIRELALNGEHEFTELASHYSNDTNITYSFGKGEMDEAFERAAFELETGEISEIVESQSGYHIIKCINTFDKEETDANKLKILEERKNEAFGQEYDAFVETLARRLNQKLWKEIELIHNNEVVTANFFEIYEKYFAKEN